MNLSRGGAGSPRMYGSGGRFGLSAEPASGWGMVRLPTFHEMGAAPSGGRSMEWSPESNQAVMTEREGRKCACGSKLSVYNRGLECAPCEAKSRRLYHESLDRRAAQVEAKRRADAKRDHDRAIYSAALQVYAEAI